MKNPTVIALALLVAISARVPAYAQNAQSALSPSGGVLEIPPASPPPSDPTASDSFKDNDAATSGDPSVAAFPPTSLSSSNSSTSPGGNDSGIAENDQNLAQSDSVSTKDPSYPGVSEYLNQQSDYASYASAYSGLPSAAIIGPSPLIRYMVFRSVMVSSTFPPPMVMTPIPMRPFGPGFAPPMYRYYAPPPRPSFGAFGGRGFGGRVGFSHR